MAKYRADVDEQRYYPDLGLTVNPADEVELPSGFVAAGLTPIDAPAKSKKSETVEPLASDDAESLGVTN